MTQLKTGSKTAQKAVRNYALAVGQESLSAVYGRYSEAKAKAFDYCRRLCSDLDGWGLRITSYNTMIFTVGFYFVNEFGVVCMAYITPSYDYYFEL